MNNIHREEADKGRDGEKVSVQTTFEQLSRRLDFQVNPTLAPGAARSSALLPDDPQDLAYEGFLKARLAAPRPVVVKGDQGLKETWPFIHFLGWDKLVDGRPVQDLVDLVKLPVRGDPLIDIVQVCQELFKAEQGVVDRSAHFMVLEIINNPVEGG